MKETTANGITVASAASLSQAIENHATAIRRFDKLSAVWEGLEAMRRSIGPKAESRYVRIPHPRFESA